MAGAREILCEGCETRVPASTVELDGSGRQLCRTCKARSLSTEANEVQQAHGARRRCRRCDAMTLVRVAGVQAGVLHGGGPGGRTSAPITGGYRFRCTCGAGMFLLSPEGIMLALALSGFVGYFAVVKVGLTEGIALGAGIAVLVILREIIWRMRYST